MTKSTESVVCKLPTFDECMALAQCADVIASFPMDKKYTLAECHIFPISCKEFIPSIAIGRESDSYITLKVVGYTSTIEGGMVNIIKTQAQKASEIYDAKKAEIEAELNKEIEHIKAASNGFKYFMNKAIAALKKFNASGCRDYAAWDESKKWYDMAQNCK